MTWSLAFEPLFSWPLLAAILAPIALIVLAGLWFRRRGGLFRFAALLALAAALVNPVLLDEEHEPLKSVVALIVDRSQSQDIGNRNAETSAALAGLQERLARFNQFDVRVIEAGRASAAEDRTETRLFSALDGAFRDVPPSRIGGAVMITDGQVHDVPAVNAFPAPLHALITGEDDERDRRIRFENAPRFGIVGKPLAMSYRILATDGERGEVDVRVSVNGQPVTTERATIGVETQRIYDPEGQFWVVFCAPAVAGMAARELMDSLFHGSEDPLDEASDGALTRDANTAELLERGQAVVREQPQGFDYGVRIVEYEDRYVLLVMNIPGKDEAVALHCALLREFPDCRLSIHFAADEIRRADPEFPGDGWFVNIHWMKR